MGSTTVDVAALRSTRADELKAAQTIIDKGKSEERPLNDDERKSVGEHLGKADDLWKQINDVNEDHRLRAALGEALKGDEQFDDGGGVHHKRFTSIGEAFVKSDAYTMAQAALASSSRYSTTAVDTGIDLKALTTTGTVYPGGHQDLPGVVTKALQRPT